MVYCTTKPVKLGLLGAGLFTTTQIPGLANARERFTYTQTTPRDFVPQSDEIPIKSYILYGICNACFYFCLLLRALLWVVFLTWVVSVIVSTTITLHVGELRLYQLG